MMSAEPAPAAAVPAESAPLVDDGKAKKEKTNEEKKAEAKAKAEAGAKSANEKLDKKNFLDARGMKTNLFGFLNDPMGCALVCCLPCVVGGVTRALVDGREWTVMDCLCMSNAYTTRQSMRTKYKQGYDTTKDCIGSCCCLPCFMHQNAREQAVRSGDQVRWLPPPPADEGPATQSAAL